jgi:hypothetical protein
VTSALDLLARRDKWFLSAGEGLLWAPPFPAWLHAPGFWDDAHVFQYPVGPLFTVSFVDDAGASLDLDLVAQRWTPAALESAYQVRVPAAATAHPLVPVESRMVLPGFVLASEWTLKNGGETPLRLHAIAWSAAPGDDVAAGSVTASETEISWPRRLRDRRAQERVAVLSLAVARGTDSWAAARSESTANHPLFRLTPFWDRWDPVRAGLSNRTDLEGVSAAGLVYVGLHRVLEIAPGTSARLAVALHVDPRLPVRSTAREPSAYAPKKASTFAAASRAHWEDYFKHLPSFRCSDPYFERAWAYRWYGLKLNAIAGGLGNYPAPTVCEGIAVFHEPITYSAQCHLRELRWASDPEWARGVLRTFLAHQKADGSFHGRIYADHLEGTDFYHADWGGALLALDAVHPSDTFLREVLPGLGRYADWLVLTRDPEGRGLYDVVDQYETGQEYMSRYQAVDPDADRYGWENRLRLKGVDVTVYAYALFRALERLAPRVGLPAEGWRARADKTAKAVLNRMWDPGAGMFFDVDPQTGERTGVSAAVCFYPYFTDLVGEPHLAGFQQHLFDTEEFWTTFPVPSSSQKDPRFDPDAVWKGKRHNCPWNGRVWPMTNSHVAEAIAAVALSHAPALRDHAAEFITKYVRMMFWDGDAERPNAFEHYHPLSGRPCAYRGIDDYQHSWINDLVVQYVVGLRPAGAGRFVVDPFPFPLDGLEARGLPMQGASVDVRRSGEEVRVRVNRRDAGRGALGTPIVVEL